MVSCLLLCAGLSSRFGSPKALARLGPETVVSRLQNMLLASQVHEIIIVTGAHAKEIQPSLLNHKKIKVVHNKDYILGQTSSFKAGLDEVCPSSTGLMLLPIDFPLVQTETIDILVEEFEKDPEKIIIPTYGPPTQKNMIGFGGCSPFSKKLDVGLQKGHPPIFPASLKEEFLLLEPSEGLHVVQRRHSDTILFCEVNDAGVKASFNTPEEFKKIRG